MDPPLCMGFRIPKTEYQCCVYVNTYGVHEFPEILKGVCDTHTHAHTQPEKKGDFSFKYGNWNGTMLPEGAGFLLPHMFR